MEWDEEAAEAAYMEGQRLVKLIAAEWGQKAASFGDYEEQFWEGVFEAVQDI